MINIIWAHDWYFIPCTMLSLSTLWSTVPASPSVQRCSMSAGWYSLQKDSAELQSVWLWRCCIYRPYSLSNFGVQIGSLHPQLEVTFAYNNYYIAHCTGVCVNFYKAECTYTVCSCILYLHAEPSVLDFQQAVVGTVSEKCLAIRNHLPKHISLKLKVRSTTTTVKMHRQETCCTIVLAM